MTTTPVSVRLKICDCGCGGDCGEAKQGREGSATRGTPMDGGVGGSPVEVEMARALRNW